MSWYQVARVLHSTKGQSYSAGGTHDSVSRHIRSKHQQQRVSARNVGKSPGNCPSCNICSKGASPLLQCSLMQARQAPLVLSSAPARTHLQPCITLHDRLYEVAKQAAGERQDLRGSPKQTAVSSQQRGSQAAPKPRYSLDTAPPSAAQAIDLICRAFITTAGQRHNSRCRYT